MKKHILTLAAGLILLSGCNNFLDLKPQGQENSENYLNTKEGAIRAVNGIYDLLGQSEGKAPDGRWLAHHHEFFFGSMITDDTEKGSKPSDMPDLISLIEWTIDPSSALSDAFWIHGFWGVSRSNYVLKNLPASPIDETLKNRLMGEAYFMRGYYYFYLLRVFGGVPVFEEPVQPSEYGKVARASVHETFIQIEKDFQKAITLLPERSEYPAADLGRATKGAARAFLARMLMYQIGVDTQCERTWKDVQDQTSAIIKSGEYQLMSNFAAIFEDESENNSESVFEIQALEGASGDAPASTGTAYFYFQANRVENKGANTGYGFNNPTQDLVSAFEPTDPRLSTTVYGVGFNNEVLYGQKMKFDRAQQGSDYLNRKAALPEKPNQVKSGGRNIILMRYADVYLMHAEACFHMNDEGNARFYLNEIRKRARNSTLCKGYNEGSPKSYPAPTVAPQLKDVTASGQNLLEAIWKERRLELALENIRAWDLIRTGKFLEVSGKVKDTDRIGNGNNEEQRYTDYSAKCQRHCITGKDGVKIPVLPIPLTEVQSWGLEQNPY